jgi:hypothetical protein
MEKFIVPNSLGGAKAPAALAAVLLALGSAGCGGDGASRSAEGTTADRPEAAQAKAAVQKAKAAARKTGRQACEGMTPLEVAKKFRAPALRAGVSEGLAGLATSPPARVLRSPGYPRLAAAVYAETRPLAERPYAAAGCVQALTQSSKRKAATR